MEISASLVIPAEQVDLLETLFSELKELRAALSESDILTEEQAAAALKVSLSTLRKWRNEGWLPFFSEGKLVKHERKALLLAYKEHFGKATHYGVLQMYSTPKRRAS